MQIWTFHALSIKIFFSEITTNPLAMGSVLPNLGSLQFWTLYSIFNKKFLSEVGPSLTFVGENSCHCWENLVSFNIWMKVGLLFRKLFLL